MIARNEGRLFHCPILNDPFMVKRYKEIEDNKDCCEFGKRKYEFENRGLS